MRDILSSTKGRTQSQKDYGYDAGDYMPALERRQTLPPFIVTADGHRIYNRHDMRTQGAYGRIGRLAQAQETAADNVIATHWALRGASNPMIEDELRMRALDRNYAVAQFPRFGGK